mmetsp:Transcript_10723/g.15007  ORF Transcript_10723/g.15007 Transcript_10723/m.15007 type:complete len:287 (+) Transcript_10723:718-1578(+)
MSSSLSWATRRWLSARASAVGIVTTTNSARSSSRKSSSSSNIWNWKARRRSLALATASFLNAASLLMTELTALKTALVFFRRSRMRMRRSKKSPRKSGKASSRSVCPVGAVSITTRSNLGRPPPSPSPFTRSSTFARATSSSVPGGAVSSTSAKEENCRSSAESSCAQPPTAALNSPRAAAGSTSSAHRPAGAPPPVPYTPSMGTSSPLDRSACSASPSECAGSVDTTTVSRPSAAKEAASAALEEVLPTPPLPPKITNRASPSPSSPLPSRSRKSSAQSPPGAWS